MMKLTFLALLLLAAQLPGEEPAVRIGHFANITHAQAILGHGNGAYERALGAPIEWKIFNAGPAEMEALVSGHIDIAYVGPNPAINAFIKSEGEALRIVAGSSSGGASLVIHPHSAIKTDKDFNNKKITTPQLGNTQDVAARKWLLSKGYQFKEKGGTVSILPIPNAEQLILFTKGEVDAAWAPEPWATRFVQEASGVRYLDERELWPEKKFCTAVVVVRNDFLKSQPHVVRKILGAHLEATDWIKANPEKGRRMINAEIGREIGKPLPEKVIDESWKWFEVTYDPVSRSIAESADAAYELGFLGKQKPNIEGIYDFRLLNKLLVERKLPKVE